MDYTGCDHTFYCSHKLHNLGRGPDKSSESLRAEEPVPMTVQLV